VSIAANKEPGVRAALCIDAETAKGARLWNEANVLCMSLRLTSQPAASGIIDAWTSTLGIDETERDNIESVKRMDQERAGKEAA
jgi:ribose 5-phosphate isomerase B